MSTTTRSPSVKSFTIPDSPLRSLIMQSKEILQATATSSTETTTVTVTRTQSLKIIQEVPENLPENEQIDEHMKQNTPEMKRRGITEKIKDNVKNTGRGFMSRLSSFNESSDEPEPPIGLKINTHLQVDPPVVSRELDGQAKFWLGKDYSNFILKDFTDLNQPFQDLIDRTKTPRVSWVE